MTFLARIFCVKIELNETEVCGGGGGGGGIELEVFPS